MRCLTLLPALVLIGACCGDPTVAFHGACGHSLIVGKTYELKASYVTPGCGIGSTSYRPTGIEQIETDGSKVLEVVPDRKRKWSNGTFEVRALREGRATLQIETKDGPGVLELHVAVPARYQALYDGEPVSKLVLLEGTQLTLEFRVLDRNGTELSPEGYRDWYVLPEHSLIMWARSRSGTCANEVTYRSRGPAGTGFEIRQNIAGSVVSAVSGRFIAEGDIDEVRVTSFSGDTLHQGPPKRVSLADGKHLSLWVDYLTQGLRVVGVPYAIWSASGACSVSTHWHESTFELLKTGQCQITLSVPAARGGKGLGLVYTVQVE